MYLNKWYPADRQARIMSILFLAMPLGMVLGEPISGALMTGTHDLHGLQGWQWMFLLEALPAILLGLLVLRMLPESPQSAAWLTPEEAAAVSGALSAENARKSSRLVDALKNPILWMLMAICLLFNIGNYGLVFWLPTIIQSTGMQSPLEIAFLTAIPYGVACVVMNRNAAHAERSGERRLHTRYRYGGGRGHVGQHAVPAQYGGGDGVPDHRRVRADGHAGHVLGLPGRILAGTARPAASP